MAHYRSAGHVPPKRHTQHRSPSGELYYEELVGEEGFSSDSSLLYHIGIPPPSRTCVTGNYLDHANDQVELAVRVVMDRQARPIEQHSANLWGIIREAVLLDMPGSPRYPGGAAQPSDSSG
jgi:homogentisate 1,2-dioxygenase